MITEGIQHVRSEPEPDEAHMLLLIDTMFSNFYDDVAVLARPEREAQLQKCHLCKVCPKEGFWMTMPAWGKGFAAYMDDSSKFCSEHR